MKELNGNDKMSSREIAELTGKQHKNVMQSIRNMEPAWEKVNGLKFQLVKYKDPKGEERPEYKLNKTECLYVATKFNDEARAKLVLRWEELETNKQNITQSEVLLQTAQVLVEQEKKLDDLDSRVLKLERSTEMPIVATNSLMMVVPKNNTKSYVVKIHNINRKRFGKILYTLRKKYDLVQDDVANNLKVRRASYSGIERGTFGAGPKVIIGLYNFWKEKGELITIDYLYGVENTPGNRLGDQERQHMARMQNEIDQKDAEIEKLKMSISEQQGMVKTLVDKL